MYPKNMLKYLFMSLATLTGIVVAATVWYVVSVVLIGVWVFALMAQGCGL